METNAAILEKLSSIEMLLASAQSDYCDTKEAARIIGLENTRYLKQLNEGGYLPRYARGKGFVYKKKDCYLAATKLDQKIIVLKPLTIKHDEE